MRFVTLLISLFALSINLQAQGFTVVIDAGHGGKDPGAISANKKIYEKDITLNVALMVGKAIEENHPEVKVLYTRKTDRFVGLNDRAKMANRANADLFISIHTNAAKNRTAKGAETYTLGIEESRTERNLEIAKRENGVILLEENHEKTYANFNPESPESYIIFEYIQSEYVKESIHMAQYVQENLSTEANRLDRGVRQAGFLVLNATSMPSVLVELGYISNTEEAKYLASANGQKRMSICISNAFDKYYEDLVRQSNNTTNSDTPQTTREQVNNNANEDKTKVQDNTPVFKIQLMSSTKKLQSNDKAFKGLNPVECYFDKGMYKYTTGSSTDYYEIVKLKKRINEKFKDAFIVAFINNERTDTQQAIALFKQTHP